MSISGLIVGILRCVAILGTGRMLLWACGQRPGVLRTMYILYTVVNTPRLGKSLRVERHHLLLCLFPLTLSSKREPAGKPGTSRCSWRKRETLTGSGLLQTDPRQSDSDRADLATSRAVRSEFLRLLWPRPVVAAVAWMDGRLEGARAMISPTTPANWLNWRAKYSH